MSRSHDPAMKAKRYLGDGVYAGVDGVWAGSDGVGFQLWLWAERDGMEHAVALDDTTLAALDRYVKDLKRAVGNNLARLGDQI
jgi:hypothetical protein